jgi:diacylglycerol kinase family enzyme
MDDILVIFNPAARSERARGFLERVAALPRAQLRPTTAPGDARRLAEEAARSGARVCRRGGRRWHNQ